MSAFFTNLWESIFTPGPTHTLLVATNAAFAALQALFFALLLATSSIHFLILSFISGGLWYAINWFVAELKATAAAEEEKKKKVIADLGGGDDTETEAETVIDDEGGLGSKEVEVLETKGQLKDRGSRLGSKSEVSTEDEWERVSENEKDK